jgi:glycosyltransferase involved in cell wall biosynthesis
VHDAHALTLAAARRAVHAAVRGVAAPKLIWSATADGPRFLSIAKSAAVMRVLHVINAFARGGAEVFVGALAVELQRQGARAAIVATSSFGRNVEQPFRRALESAGIETFSLVEDGPRSTPLRAYDLAWLVRRWGANVTHLHTVSAAALGFVGGGAPGVQSFHAGRLLPPRRWLKQATEATLARLVRANVAVSQAVVADAARRTGLRAADVVVMPNGVDFARFADAAPDPARLQALLGRERAPGETVALVVARIDANKGHDVIIDAVAELGRRGQPAAAIFAGRCDAEPAWTAALRQRVHALGLDDRIRFAGVIDDVAPLMRAADLVVSASRSEAMGLTVIEAIAAGRPVAVSDIPPHREATNDGRLGRTFGAGDPDALADAWQQTVVAGLAPDALAFVTARYSIAVCAQRHLALYTSIQ